MRGPRSKTRCRTVPIHQCPITQRPSRVARAPRSIVTSVRKTHFAHSVLSGLHVQPWLPAADTIQLRQTRSDTARPPCSHQRSRTALNHAADGTMAPFTRPAQRARPRSPRPQDRHSSISPPCSTIGVVLSLVTHRAQHPSQTLWTSKTRCKAENSCMPDSMALQSARGV
jgi:hypothetical protein